MLLKQPEILVFSGVERGRACASYLKAHSDADLLLIDPSLHRSQILLKKPLFVSLDSVHDFYSRPWVAYSNQLEAYNLSKVKLALFIGEAPSSEILEMLSPEAFVVTDQVLSRKNTFEIQIKWEILEKNIGSLKVKTDLGIVLRRWPQKKKSVFKELCKGYGLEFCAPALRQQKQQRWSSWSETLQAS
jgi:hypothetical protein